jgi:hypothetical protein
LWKRQEKNERRAVMGKKLICFPFVDGNLQDYSFNNLSDEEIERAYNGEEVYRTFAYDKNKKEIWKPNEEVELTLHYEGFGRGKSSVTFYWADDDGHGYPMFVKDVDELLRQNIGASSVRGVFTYVKRGANYGIKLLRKIEQPTVDIKTKVAREIFAEIEKVTASVYNDFMFNRESVGMKATDVVMFSDELDIAIAELKNKYTKE